MLQLHGERATYFVSLRRAREARFADRGFKLTRNVYVIVALVLRMLNATKQRWASRYTDVTIRRAGHSIDSFFLPGEAVSFVKLV